MMLLDELIKTLQLHRNVVGNVPVVFKSGETEDDIDTYVIYSYVARAERTTDHHEKPIIMLREGDRAFKW